MITLLFLLVVGAQAQHRAEWTYSGKAHPRGSAHFSRVKPGQSGATTYDNCVRCCWGFRISG